METEKLLDRVNSPADIKKFSIQELNILAQEIRELMIDVTSHNGGHLAPSLGVVELTLALHYVFDTPTDKFVWDVGHQAYAHKIITGRREKFATLRQTHGISGFPMPEESPYDAFVAGHAGVSISAALGMAVARDKLGRSEKIIAILGDASITCGVTQEAMNNVANATKDLIIVLNDNRMAISPNVGAMTRYLNTLISAKWYNRFKNFIKQSLQPLDGSGRIRRFIARTEEGLKRILVRSVIFEEFGVRYIGPIDGHDLRELITAFQRIKGTQVPVIIHVITEKGHGYKPAMEAPEKFHGIGQFDKETGETHPGKGGFSAAFGATALELAEHHSEVVALTAAMCSGTGLTPFRAQRPQQFYDVGIAESHGVVFGAGLAAAGLRPIVAIYATFMQRALDHLFHDVCLQNLPVIFACDRAGAVDDGPTHHGIHDIGFLKGMPHLSILQPRNENELRQMLHAAYKHTEGAVMLRYPRGKSPAPFDPTAPIRELPWGKAEVVREGTDLAIFALGVESYTAEAIADILAQHALSVAVINIRFVIPFDDECLQRYAMQMPIVTLEDHCVENGIAAIIGQRIASLSGAHPLLLSAGWHLKAVPHGKQAEVRAEFGFTADAIAKQIVNLMKTKKEA